MEKQILKELIKKENKKNKALKAEKKIINKKFKMERKASLRALNEPPHLTVLEEIGNSITHGVGALLAIAGLVVMIIKSNTALEIFASIVYMLSMFFMMLCSSLYHAFKSGLEVKRVFRRFDYSSIYLLIGGTFAPLYLVYWGNTIGIVLFCIQWALIITGITMVCVFGPGRLKWLHFPLYFILGWSGIIFIPDFIHYDIKLLAYILIGGLVYTFGMIPFVKRNVKSAHFIWHFFVLAGAFIQWLGIFIVLY